MEPLQGRFYVEIAFTETFSCSKLMGTDVLVELGCAQIQVLSYMINLIVGRRGSLYNVPIGVLYKIICLKSN